MQYACFQIKLMVCTVALIGGTGGLISEDLGKVRWGGGGQRQTFRILTAALCANSQISDDDIQNSL